MTIIYVDVKPCLLWTSGSGFEESEAVAVFIQIQVPGICFKVLTSSYHSKVYLLLGTLSNLILQDPDSITLL